MATEIVPGVTADPSVAFGKPTVAGTRVPAAVILEQLAAGRSQEDLCRDYELIPEQIRAVLRHAAMLAGQETIRTRAG